MKKSEFLLEVKAELDNIKSKATQEEISRLDFKDFNHTFSDKCIYGQMTGWCSNDRAIELSPKVYKSISKKIINRYLPFSQQSMSTKYQSYTALEKYLFMVKISMHEKIISYLKGEIDTIELV